MFFNKSASGSLIKNIATLNPYNHQNYIYSNDAYYPLEKLTYNTSNLLTSYIRNKDVITATVNISRTIPEEDIEDILEIKAYEELGLDQARSYTITSIEVESVDEERTYHIFVSEPEEIGELFSPIKEECKYVDLIVPAQLLYRALYTKEILEEKHVHCFVYFTQDDATVTLYRNGQYLYAKSIDFSLSQIYDKYCEIIGEQVDTKEFYHIFESEGLKTTNPEYQQNLMKIFAEVFITINDIIIYVKRAFNLNTIDQMFIGSSRGPIIGLDDYSENYLGLHSTEFNFNYHVSSDEWYTDQLHYLMLLTALEYLETGEEEVNLTIFPRPPAFVHRASGQFIIAIFSVVSLSLAYPLIFLIGSYVNDAKIYTLGMENEQLTTQSKHYKKILGEKQRVMKGLDNKIKKLSTIYHGKSKTLSSIYDKKVNCRLKSATFHMLAEDLGKYEVQVEKIRTEDDKLLISLVSTDDRKLTELIKYISETHFDELKSIDIERIEKEDASQYYKGQLKMELK